MPGQGVSFRSKEDGDPDGFTAWSIFKQETKYFQPSSKPFMMNFRVQDLDGLLEKLRSGDSARSVVFQMHAVAAAWNAYFEGRKLKEVRVRWDKPFRIAGTPVMVERLEQERSNG